MDENWLEIRKYNGKGFQPLIFFDGWRVAILNYIDDVHPRNIKTMERHIETDEIFVLLNGRGTLIVGGNNARVDDIHAQRMEPGKLYNVKRYTWHTILLSRDASVLLVENRDTGAHNSNYMELTSQQCKQILDIAKHGKFE